MPPIGSVLDARVTFFFGKKCNLKRHLKKHQNDSCVDCTTFPTTANQSDTEVPIPPLIDYTSANSNASDMEVCDDGAVETTMDDYSWVDNPFDNTELDSNLCGSFTSNVTVI
jgi:hypothetical protein